MKTKHILLITIIISLALIGLAGIQVYWINNAIKVRQTGFDRSVNEAVTKVIHKLEKNEMTEQIRQKESFYKRGSDIFRSIDSINLIYYQELELLQHKGQDQSLPPDSAARQRLIRLLQNKSSLFNDVFEDMYTFRHYMDIEQRIDLHRLDSMIRTELRQTGIRTEFELGVYSTSRNRLVIEKTGNYSRELLEKSIGFTLFPGDASFTPDYLLIYFPREKQFLLNQMAGMLSISVFLILVIIIAFVLTIKSVIQEKKLASMKTDFINNMTHEFKTPISTISLACEALADNDIKNMEGISENYINIINEENKRLGIMAEKILQTAVLEKGKLKLSLEEVNIHKILVDVINNIAIQVEINDGTIVKDFRATSPDLQADKIHLSNVCYNLLENANKYSPKKPHIVVTTMNVEGGIEIAIKDNGIGISKSDQKKVFDKLYRVPQGDLHNFKGFGLGLSYVKAIVEKHNGHIHLESEEGKGSVFTVFLPFDQ
ncbi:MAG TPA: HAMP domain-containing sensor histidine kinase [Bacteroidales bacterium]|nr:HAMP domain-containing sensor histidine kinase [Bacteroidales bacterium]HNS46960.1 HAMP domain-containing sensor histidine kinase [Bacteroidales bacterium]